MKLVRLTRDMRPRCAGSDVLLPDEAADRLLACGEADNPRDRFGAPLTEPVPADRRRAYKTK